MPERTLQLALLLRLTNWWTGQVRPTTFAQCRVLTAGQYTRAVALYANNKRTRVTSKLVSSPLLLSTPLIYVRAVPCPDLRSVHTRCRALCSFIKKHRNSSKLDSCVLYSFAHCACSPRLLWLLADVCEDTTIYIEDVSVNCI